MDEKLETIIAEYGPLSSEALVDIKEVGQIREVAKGDILVREGDFSYELFYVVQVGARAHYLKEGKTIADWFAFENDFISSIISIFFKYLANIIFKYWKILPLWCCNFKILKHSGINTMALNDCVD